MVRGKPTKAKEGTKPYVFAVRRNYKPSADHPWRRFKPVVSEANLKAAKKKKRDYY